MNITLTYDGFPASAKAASLSPACIAAPPSKSDAHRLLILSALSVCNKPICVSCRETNADIDATIGCLSALGADIRKTDDGYAVTPIDRSRHSDDTVCMDAGESGSTLRFLIPVIGALGKTACIRMHGRLPYRPLAPLDTVLRDHGMYLAHDRNDETLLHVSGNLLPGTFEIDGGVSSQFISGLLFALPLLAEPSVLRITGTVASAPYIRLTLSVLRRFGFYAEDTEDMRIFRIAPTDFVPETDLRVEGDWSGAAFLLCAGAMSGMGVTVTSLAQNSVQGDKRILDVLAMTGCTVTWSDDAVTVIPPSPDDCPLSPFSLNADDIPDLVPPMAALACACRGKTVISGCGRLKIKESDRLSATAAMLRALGGTVSIDNDTIIIQGTGTLSGGCADGCGDHRMVMSAALCALIAAESVAVTDSEAIGKSYPGFFSDFRAFGIQTNYCNPV